MQYQKKTHGFGPRPVKDLSIAPVDNEINFVQPAKKEKPLVLVFSRDADASFLYRTILEIWSYRVKEFSALEDLPVIIENELPDLILMDGVRQFEENLENLRRIRADKRFCCLPVILVSGFVQDAFRNSALACGADDFLVKPLDFDLLERTVKKNIRGFAGGVRLDNL